MIDDLLNWYSTNKRDIPWRETKTPYAIWVSEIMCQQTRIETVIPYYLRFMEKLPTIETLANCEEDVLLKLWQGLGYYNRVRNMQIAAKEIMRKHQGIFPNTFKDVVALKGIGTYTASAILAIAFNQKYAAVDGNLLRVFSRLWRDSSDISLDKTKEAFKEKIERIITRDPGDFNQAIMDIGATICLPNDVPLCDKCPLYKYCQAFMAQDVLKYPVKTKKVGKKEAVITVFLIELNGKILIRKRAGSGLLKGLYEFKNIEKDLSIEEIRELFKKDLIRVKKGPDLTHVFTHKKWIMHSYFLQLSDYTLLDQEYFVTKDELQQYYSMPTAFYQFLKFIK